MAIFIFLIALWLIVATCLSVSIECLDKNEFSIIEIILLYFGAIFWPVLLTGVCLYFIFWELPKDIISNIRNR